MKKLIIFIVVMTLCSCSLSPNSDTSIPEASAESSTPQTPPSRSVPSLYIELAGERVLLLDMDDPIMQSCYTGCGGFNLGAMDTPSPTMLEKIKQGMWMNAMPTLYISFVLE